MILYEKIIGNPDDVADEFGRSSLYFKLGYFSLIGLLRTHVLLGDYHQALKTVENLVFHPKVKVLYLRKNSYSPCFWLFFNKYFFFQNLSMD